MVAEHLNAKRITIVGALLHWTQENSFELVVHQNHGHLSRPGNCYCEPTFSRKLDVTSWIPIN